MKVIKSFCEDFYWLLYFFNWISCRMSSFFLLALLVNYRSWLHTISTLHFIHLLEYLIKFGFELSMYLLRRDYSFEAFSNWFKIDEIEFFAFELAFLSSSTNQVDLKYSINSCSFSFSVVSFNSTKFYLLELNLI